MENRLFNLLTGREEKHLVPYKEFFVHKDILEPFLKLQKLAASEIGANLQIISSFRKFERQELIWNLKATGKKPLLDDQNNLLDFESLTEKELLQAILKWSAIPGASRHHWGTDLDIYDANKLSKEEVQLTHSECINNGPFAELHTWLDDKILNNDSFNFYRPYETNRGEHAVAIEKWHISHASTAKDLLESYSFDLFVRNIEISNIKLKQNILDQAISLYNSYILNINSPPF